MNWDISRLVCLITTILTVAGIAVLFAYGIYHNWPQHSSEWAIKSPPGVSWTLTGGGTVGVPVSDTNKPGEWILAPPTTERKDRE